MNPTLVGTIVFACTFGGALFGVWLHGVIPNHHLTEETKDTVKVGIGLVATMTALILGLVTASAKTSFDGVDAAVKNGALDVLTLDRLLVRYGPETIPLRAALKATIATRIETIWPTGVRSGHPDFARGASEIESMIDGLRALVPTSEAQQAYRARALDLAEQLLRVRWLVSASAVSSVPLPFLAILIFWLTITFASFGLFAPRNGTAIGVLLVCALSVGAAVFLVLEMDGPFDGILTVSPAPLQYAYEHVD